MISLREGICWDKFCARKNFPDQNPEERETNELVSGIICKSV